MNASWRAVVHRLDRLHGAGTLRTLASLQTWPQRLKFAKFVLKSRLGFPYRGELAPKETATFATRDGYRFEPRSGSADREVLSPFHEVQTRSLLRRHFKRAPSGGVFIDVGAHCGSFSILYEAFFEAVIALEPLPDNYRALVRNVSLNALERKVHSLPIAAGERRANGTLFLRGDEMSTLVPTDAGTTLGVDVRTLDAVLDGEQVRPAEVRLLKADVEGAELEVLAGSRRLLEAGTPLVVLEALTPAAQREQERFLEPLGYVLVREADGRNLFFQRLR